MARTTERVLEFLEKCHVDEGYTYTQVATAIGKSESAAKNSLLRLLASGEVVRRAEHVERAGVRYRWASVYKVAVDWGGM